MSIAELVEQFQYEKVLDSDSQLKTIALLGTIASKPAILQLEKSHFNWSEKELKNPPIKQIRDIATNDVYHWGMNLLEQDIDAAPASKVNLIYPATETHIRKFNKPVMRVVTETPEIYQEIVKPYVERMRGDRIQWVRNILHHGAEAERVIFKNEDFVLIPDMKWDGETMESLYLCCIVYRDDIASIRDLNKFHIKYLERLLKTLRTEVPRYYQSDAVTADSLRIFVHYQPSYYHFHIHVVHAGYNGLGASILAGKAILLEDVIENLRILPVEGYSKRRLTYVINESHELWELGLKKANDERSES